jgi:hypothetical protein
MFTKFNELKTKEEQAMSEELKNHATRVMETVDESIRSLDELDVFFQYLHEIGASHTRIPGFTSEYFWVSVDRMRKRSPLGILFTTFLSD